MALGQVRTARAAADGRGAAGLAPRQGDLGAHQLQVRLRHGGTAEHIRQRLDSSSPPASSRRCSSRTGSCDRVAGCAASATSAWSSGRRTGGRCRRTVASFAFPEGIDATDRSGLASSRSGRGRMDRGAIGQACLATAPSPADAARFVCRSVTSSPGRRPRVPVRRWRDGRAVPAALGGARPAGGTAPGRWSGSWPPPGWSPGSCSRARSGCPTCLRCRRLRGGRSAPAGWSGWPSGQPSRRRWPATYAGSAGPVSATVRPGPRPSTRLLVVPARDQAAAGAARAKAVRLGFPRSTVRRLPAGCPAPSGRDGRAGPGRVAGCRPARPAPAGGRRRPGPDRAR